MIASTEQIAGGPATKLAVSIKQMEPLCAAYDCECVELEIKIAQLEADMEIVKQNHLPSLKRQAAKLAAREAELYNAIESAPDFFIKPKTLVIAGTKIGFANSVGSVTFEDSDYVVTQIAKLLPERFEALVKITSTPRKDALRELSEKDLGKLGCQVVGAGPTVILKRVSGDVEKLINKLIEKLVGSMVGGEK